MTTYFDNDPWAARLSEYVDGEMSTEEAQALEAHVATCETCRMVLRDLGAVVQTLHEFAVTPSVTADPDRLWPRVLNNLSTDRIAVVESIAYQRSRLIDAIVAALILAIGIATGYWLGQCGRTNGWPRPGWLTTTTMSAPAIKASRPPTKRAC